MTATVAREAAVGFIGLGDQGLPMAQAIAQAGHPLHVWARSSRSLTALDVDHVAHEGAGALAEACSVVMLCVSSDAAVLSLATGRLLPSFRAGSVLVNHGTGTPANAQRLAHLADEVGVTALDAPVSGGRPGAEARALTTMVGGDEQAARRCEPLFRSFSTHVVRLGEAGAGQSAKIFNNLLLALNQNNIAQVVQTAVASGLEPARLVEVLRLGSANSRALELMNTMVTPGTVEHQSALLVEDLDIFDEAMRDIGVDADALSTRGRSGIDAMPGLIRLLDQGSTSA